MCQILANNIWEYILPLAMRPLDTHFVSNESFLYIYTVIYPPNNIEIPSPQSTIIEVHLIYNGRYTTGQKRRS